MFEDHQECRVCGEVLPIHQFHRDAQRPTGRMKVCASCRSATRKDYFLPAMEDRLDSISSSDVVRFAGLYEPDEETGCWLWRGSITNTYPSFWFAGGRIRAHRFSVAASGVELPLDAQVHHECGQRLCVRPDHLTPLSGEEHRAIHAERNRQKTRPRRTRRNRLGSRGR